MNNTHKSEENHFIWVRNDGPRILETNFFTSDICRSGKFFVSINEGAIRLLLPDRWLANVLSEIRDSGYSIFTRAPALNMAEILFEDETDSPYSLQFSENCMDRLPPIADDGRNDLTLSIWSGDSSGKVTCQRTMPCRFRVADRIPYLKRWEETPVLDSQLSASPSEGHQPEEDTTSSCAGDNGTLVIDERGTEFKRDLPAVEFLTISDLLSLIHEFDPTLKMPLYVLPSGRRLAFDEFNPLAGDCTAGAWYRVDGQVYVVDREEETSSNLLVHLREFEQEGRFAYLTWLQPSTAAYWSDEIQGRPFTSDEHHVRYHPDQGEWHVSTNGFCFVLPWDYCHRMTSYEVEKVFAGRLPEEIAFACRVFVSPDGTPFPELMRRAYAIKRGQRFSDPLSGKKRRRNKTKRRRRRGRRRSS